MLRECFIFNKFLTGPPDLMFKIYAKAHWLSRLILSVVFLRKQSEIQVTFWQCPFLLILGSVSLNSNRGIQSSWKNESSQQAVSDKTWQLLLFFKMLINLSFSANKQKFICSKTPRFLHTKLIKCRRCHPIETSQLIYRTNQLTGFYMMAALAFHELIQIQHHIQPAFTKITDVSLPVLC